MEEKKNRYETNYVDEIYNKKVDLDFIIGLDDNKDMKKAISSRSLLDFLLTS